MDFVGQKVRHSDFLSDYSRRMMAVYVAFNAIVYI